MLRVVFYLLILAIAFVACEQHNQEDFSKEVAEVEMPQNWCKHNVSINNHSYAKLDEARTSHLFLDLKISTQKKQILGIARHKIINNGADTIRFDTRNLNVFRVTLGSEEEKVDYKIGEDFDYIGAELIVPITPETELVNIYYETTEGSEAIDWITITDEQGKTSPFLYTQGQAILTRTWIPLQDTPENRITYSAKVTLDDDLLPLMSATNPISKNEERIYEFEMKQAIPSYLIALAVGDLTYHQYDERTGVYALPSKIKDVAWEFEDMPKMLSTAEALYGEYLWGKFDVLVLPPSFPFGGMENPKLTFATPTLIAGDRSLVSVIAHELAHSWSGNLVTNASWDDLWLNEGFTVYFENRIMEEIYGKEIADMLFLIEFQELQETIETLRAAGKLEDTRLKLDLSCRNPDEGLSDIAYVKGALFLKSLESELGREKMDEFLNWYFEVNAFKTITTKEFEKRFSDWNGNNKLAINLKEWLHGTGLPENHVKIQSQRFDDMHKLAREVKSSGQFPKELKRADKTTQEWIAFIRFLEKDLDTNVMKIIDDQLEFSTNANSEIKTEWFLLGINMDWQEIQNDIRDFLIHVGRRKFLEPIYTELAKTPKNKQFAEKVFEKAQYFYHAISKNTIKTILN